MVDGFKSGYGSLVRERVMVHWLQEGLWFTCLKKGYGSLVRRRVMVHW
jgi:hypothetical protein